MTRKLSLWILLAAVITTILQAVVYAPSLPDPMVSHFGASGVGDATMGKVWFLSFIVGLQVGLAAFLVGLGVVMSKLPPSMLNIPNKEYWLHEDRKDATMIYQRHMLYWIAAITAVFMVVIFQLTIHANLTEKAELNMVVFALSTVAYLIAVFVICGKMMIKFGRVPKLAA